MFPSGEHSMDTDKVSWVRKQLGLERDRQAVGQGMAVARLQEKAGNQ